MTSIMIDTDKLVEMIRAAGTSQFSSILEKSDKFYVTAEFADVPKTKADYLLASLRFSEAQAAEAKEKVDAAKQAIIDEMNGAEVMRIAETGQEIVSYRVVTATTVDVGKLRLEYPDIATKFQRPRTSRPFKVLTK